MSLCESNYNYNECRIDSKIAKCQQKIKNKDLIISDLVNQSELFLIILQVKKNLQILFQRNHIKLYFQKWIIKNIGRDILIFIITFNIICGIFFYKCGYPLLEQDITTIIKKKKNELFSFKIIIFLSINKTQYYYYLI